MDTIYDFSSVGHQIYVLRFYLLVLEPYSLSSSDRNTVTIRRYSLVTISKKYHWTMRHESSFSIAYLPHDGHMSHWQSYGILSFLKSESQYQIDHAVIALVHQMR